MGRFNRGLANRPVMSEKHEITGTFLAQNASTNQLVTLVAGTRTVTDTASTVPVGSTVKWIYFELNLNGVDNSGASQVVHWCIFKNPSGEFESGDLDPINYDQPTKRFILHRGMEMLPEIPLDSGGTVQVKRVFVVKIPPRMRRIGQDDKIVFAYHSTSTSGINLCFFAVFKHFE